MIMSQVKHVQNGRGLDLKKIKQVLFCLKKNFKIYIRCKLCSMVHPSLFNIPKKGRNHLTLVGLSCSYNNTHFR